MSDASISRRHLLGAGLLVSAGGAGAWRLLDAAPDVPVQPSVEAPLEAPVEAAPAAITFAPEVEAIRGKILRVLPFLALPRETVDGFLGALVKAKRLKTRDPVRLFLLSTDFFAHGVDESRPLRFVQLYDPYRAPCYNPMEPA